MRTVSACALGAAALTSAACAPTPHVARSDSAEADSPGIAAETAVASTAAVDSAPDRVSSPIEAVVDTPIGSRSAPDTSRSVPVGDPPAPTKPDTVAAAEVAANLPPLPLIPGRSKRDSISLRAAIRAGENNPAWPVKGPEPRAGAILPNRRIIAFYGNPLSRRMGILGELDAPQMLAKLDTVVRQWEQADPSTPVQPALHLVAMVAQADAGRDGKYRLKMMDTLVERVVAGLLVADLPSLQPHAIRTALKRAIPLLPWPFHATFINQPAYVAMALEPAVRTNKEAAGTEQGALILRAWRVLKDRERDRTNAVARRLREEAEPRYDDVSVLSSTLRTFEPSIYERLRTYALEIHANLARLLCDLSVVETAGLPPMLFAAAGETTIGDAIVDDGSSDRYLDLLRVLLVRVRDVLVRFSGGHEVSVWASRRDVLDWRLKVSVRMNVPHLNEIIKSLGGHPSVTVLGGGVGTSWEFDGAGYVLADLAANAARRTLMSRSVGIATAVESLQSRVGVKAATGTPTLAHCAASGEAAQLIRQASDGVLVGPASNALPYINPRARWACEQAWEWSEALRK